MAEIQRVKCGDKFHRIEWSADGAKFLDHRKMPEGDIPCRLRYNDWLEWTTKDQVFRWVSVGFRTSLAARPWARAIPEEVKAWQDLGMSRKNACYWSQGGITPVTVGEVKEFGFSSTSAKWVAERGTKVVDLIRYARVHELENFEAYSLYMACEGDMAKATECLALLPVLRAWRFAEPPAITPASGWDISDVIHRDQGMDDWLAVCIPTKATVDDLKKLLELVEDRLPEGSRARVPSKVRNLLYDCSESGMRIEQLTASIKSGMPLEWIGRAFKFGASTEYVIQFLATIENIEKAHFVSAPIGAKKVTEAGLPIEKVLELGLPIELVAKYEDPLIDPKFVVLGLSLGLDPERILGPINAGIDPEVLDQALRFGADPLEITQALSEGFPRPALFHFLREGILDCRLMRTWFEAGVAPGAAAELTKANISPETGSAWLLKGYDAKEAIAGVSEGKDIATMERALEGIYWNDVFRRVKGGSAVFALKGTFLIYVAIMFEELMAPRSRAMNMWGPLEDVRAVFDGGYYDKYWGDSRPRTARVIGYDTLRFVCARFGLVQPKIFKEETREDLEGDIKRWLEPIKWDEASWAACIERLKHLYSPV